MTGNKIPLRCIERGEGWVLWDEIIPPEQTVNIGMQESGPTSDRVTQKTATLYRPVQVEVNDGSARAYYRQGDSREYVPGGWVYSNTLSHAYPAEKFGVSGPHETIDREDVPEEFRND